MSQQQYDNKLSGALFKNDKTKPNHPDYRGSIEDDQGNQFWVSAWIKESRNKGKFLSLALTPKDENRTAQRPSSNSDTDDFLSSQSDKIASHRQRHADTKGDMQGGPSSPSSPPPRLDFDSFDDDIPF